MIGKKINQLATELAPVSTDLTIIGDPTTGVSKKITLAQLGAIFSGAVSFYNNLAGFPAIGDINVIYCAKDTQKLYLWNGSAYTEVFPAQALLDTYQLRSEKGVSNGYASLDSGGKVPISQLPSSIMEYLGTWNAATNTPTLANGTGDNGDVYLCNVAGVVNFGAGDITFAVGDWVIYNGTIWERSSGAVGTVTSVGVTRSGDALAITGSPITTSGTINLGFAGNSTQYINGAGNLVTFPGIINEAQNLITEVYNKTGATLTKGTVVYINGGQGNLPAVTKALATGDSTSAQTYGIVRNDITNNNNGYVVVAGRISDLDTQAYTEGTQLYLSPTTAGTYTSTKPYAPQHLVYVGIVVRAHPTQGVVEVKIQNGYEMDELHNVAAQSPSNNDILQYKTATSLWTKVAGTTSNIAEGSNLYYTDARSRAALSFTAGSGAYNSTTGVITIPTNTNQLTNGANYITLGSLSAGAGISYNNTTGVIASTITQYTDAMARASISGGTGISYNSTTGVITNTITQYTDAMARASISLTTTGTSGAATYNSTTGVLNVPQYAPDLSGYVPTSRTLTINGTAFDLSANRSWSVGTVTSVGLSSATSGVTIGSTPVTTSGTITLAIATASGSQQGLLSSTDWTTFNNKQNALTNPVTGTGTTNYLPKFTGASTIGNSQIFDNGTQLAINTASPSGFGTQRFLVVGNGAASQVSRFTDGANGDLVFDFPSTTVSRITAQYGTGGVLVFANGTGFNERMRLDASGNLGLGVNPSNAYGDSRSFEIGASGILWSENPSSIYNSMTIGLNFYYNSAGNVLYKNTGIAASRYTQYQGSHIWNIAPSGTAGNAISFTQAMTLNASGNLSVGNTNDSYKLDVSGTGRFSGALNTVSGTRSIQMVSYAADWNYFKSTGANLQIGTTDASNLYIQTNNVDRLTIASTGAATFSSSVTTSGGGFVANMSTTNTPALTINRSSTGYNGIIKFQNGASDTWILGNRNTSDETFRLYNYNVGADVLIFDNSGAATFSNSVGIGIDINLNRASSPAIVSTNNQQIRIVTNGFSANLRTDGVFTTTTGFRTDGFIQAINLAIGSGYYNTTPPTNGAIIQGNLGLGTTSPSYKLDVNGVINSNSSGTGTLLLGFASGSSQIAGRITATSSPSYNATGKIGFSVTTWGANTDYGLTEVMAIDMRNADNKNPTIWMNPFGGNVGIGTTNPGQLLTIQNTSSNPYLSIIGGASATMGILLGTTGNTVDGQIVYSNSTQHMAFVTNTGERMRITSGGNVGIGTTNPTGRLNVITSGTGFTPSATGPIGGSQNTRAHFQGGEPGIMISSDINPTTGSPTGTQAYQLGLQIGFYAVNDVRNQIYYGNGPLTFVYSGNQGTSVSEYMRITSGGNVGIGLTNPSYKLHIVGATDVINATSTTTDARINIGHSGNGGYVGYANIGAGNAANTFYITNGSGVIGSGIVMNNGGNVGIGTTSPTANLVVNSNAETKAIIQTSNPSGNSNVVLEMNGNYYYDGIIRNNSAGSIVIQNGTTDNLKVNNSGIQTGAPTNGTAQPWKLGNAVLGSISTNSYIIVSVNGTTYSIPALNGLP